jgi:hypothetical protein
MDEVSFGYWLDIKVQINLLLKNETPSHFRQMESQGSEMESQSVLSDI